MNAKIVYLNWFDVKIGRLTFAEDMYWYQIYEKNLELAKKMGCPIKIIRNHSKNEKNIIQRKIPAIFNEFEISNSRRDLYEKLGIIESDTEFEKLYKVAENSDKFMKNGFWISTI